MGSGFLSSHFHFYSAHWLETKKKTLVLFRWPHVLISARWPMATKMRWFFSIYIFNPPYYVAARLPPCRPHCFWFLYLSFRSSTTSSTACLTMELSNSIHRFDKNWLYNVQCTMYIEHLNICRACTIERPIFQRQDGPCKGDDSDAVTNVKTMDDIEGDW